MKKIKLTKGKYALVDGEDYPYLSRFSWSVSHVSGYYYATTLIPMQGGKQIHVPMVNFLINSQRGLSIFHKNKDTLDNQKKNLILLSKNAFTQKNKKLSNRVTTSYYKGVCKKGKKYEASIAKDGNWYYLGRFSDEKEAAKVYNIKALELYGELAYQNICK